MNCARCSAELRPVSEMPARRRDDFTVQYWDALGLTVIGGFGMYDDPIFPDRERTVVLCLDCANVLVRDNPWLPVTARPEVPA